MSRGGGEMEERLLNASETEQRRESLYLRKKIWSEVRKMWRIALPSTLFRVMSFGCIVVAQAFIGHSSETGLAAYALIQSTFIRFIYGVMAGMSSATETLCGQAYGAQQYHMMGIYLQRSWMVDTFTATLFVPFIIFAGPILRLLGQNIEITKTVDEIYPWVIPYLYSIVFTMTMQMYLQAQMKNAIIGVLSTVALVVDIVATWWCVSVMGMGIHGALLGLNISSWTVVIAEFVYVFGGWCPHTWTGFSTAAFVDLFPMLKLSISSGFMLCLEYWYMSIIVLMSGYTEDANIAISAFSICQYIYTWEMNISLGLLGAACVRVANELGKGDADAVRFSIKVVLVVSAVIGVLCSVLCLAFGGQISYLFSDSHQVSDAVADLSIVLSLSILLNIVQPILSDVIGEVLDFGGLDIVQCARKEVTKMEFTLRDINDNRLQCCIAGKIAEIMTQENKQPNNGDICLIRYAKLENYKGELQVSNAFDSSLVLLNPDIKEAQPLKNMFHVDGNSLDMYQPKHDNVMIQEKRQKWSLF